MYSAKNVWRLDEIERVEAPSENLQQKNQKNGALFFVLLFSCVISFGFLLNPHSAHADITSNLQGWWTFDSADTSWAASTTNDVSGNGHTGTLTNFYSATSTVSGAINQALNFNGTNSYVSLTATSYGNINYSDSAWINTKSGSNEWVISNSELGGDLRVFSHNVFCEFKDIGGGGFENLQGSKTVDNGKWHNIACVRNGNTLTDYVDGVQDNTKSLTVTGSPNFGFTMLGNRTSTDAFDFNGFIDDVRIYSRALSAGDITQLYNLGYTPTVTTGAASAVTQTTATLNGNITQDNNTASSTKRGFAYSTDSALITGVSTTTESGTFGISAFTANISSLSAATTYYARAYASTATSTGFGSIQPFTTSSSVSAPSFNNFIVKLGNLFQVKLGSVFMLK